jgi:flavodoxin
MEVSAQNRTEKILVAYFSWGGNTREIARQIHQKVGGDMFEIISVNPYPADSDEAHNVARQERDSRTRPALKTHVENMGQYDIIFLGFPVWLGSIPMPIAAFLEEYNFSGKRIIPFRSYGNHDSGQSDSALRELCPQGVVFEALSVHRTGGRSLPNDISSWLRKAGISEK